MATTRVPWMVVTVVVGLSLAGRAALAAEGQVFDVQEQVKKGAPQPGFTYQQMVTTPDYTVGVAAVKEEVKLHQHPDSDHNVYVVSGQGTITVGSTQVSVKPGMLLYIPKGVPHGVKAAGGELTLVDFSQPPFDPNKTEWIK